MDITCIDLLAGHLSNSCHNCPWQSCLVGNRLVGWLENITFSFENLVYQLVSKISSYCCVNEGEYVFIANRRSLLGSPCTNSIDRTDFVQKNIFPV